MVENDAVLYALSNVLAQSTNIDVSYGINLKGCRTPEVLSDNVEVQLSDGSQIETSLLV
jgi:2-polyprenyl-6-methoxyphenol hydroxylase-like FAD-dependent oxidoreductase